MQAWSGGWKLLDLGDHAHDAAWVHTMLHDAASPEGVGQEDGSRSQGLALHDARVEAQPLMEGWGRGGWTLSSEDGSRSQDQPPGGWVPCTRGCMGRLYAHDAVCSRRLD